MIDRVPTVEETLETLRAVVSEKGPDYVYHAKDGHPFPDDVPIKCMYAHGDVPGCIVGHVLHRWGVPLEAFQSVEGISASAAVANFFPYNFMTLDQVNAVSRVLGSAQRQQDNGRTWGEALTAAEYTAREYA